MSYTHRTSHARWILPLAVLAVATSFRLGVVWNFPVHPLEPDYQEYRMLARAIVERGSFDFGPDWRQEPLLAESGWNFLYEEEGAMFRPPGYPAFLAALQVTLGPDLRRHQAALALIDGISAVLVFWIGARLFGAGAGLGAAALFIMSPGMTYQVMRLGREPFLSLFMALGLLCTLGVLQRGAVASGAAAGLAFGIGGYFKETLFPIGIASALFLFGFAWLRSRKALVRPAIAMLLLLLSCPLPWMARNAILHGRFVGFTNAAGLVMWPGLVPKHWLQTQPESVRAELDPRLATNAFDANRRLWGQVRAFALQEPATIAATMARNAALFWSPIPRHTWLAIFPSLSIARAGPSGSTEAAPPFGATEAASLGYYLVLFALAARGLWVHRRSDASALVVWLLLCATAIHSLTLSVPRYRLPFEVLLLPFAGVVLASLFQRIGSRPRLWGN